MALGCIMKSYRFQSGASVSSASYVVLILTSITSAHEVHSGHQAVHGTELWQRRSASQSMNTKLPQYDDARQRQLMRRSRPNRLQPDETQTFRAIRTREEELEYERVVNITTELQDMKSEYTGSIGVGTTSTGDAVFKARVVFDTGSTNLWVASVLCQKAPCDSRPRALYYDPTRSVTHEAFSGRDGEDIDIMFGTGELKGPIHVDTYRVGPMVVKQQPFAMIREMTGDVFSSFEFEGILGLAFKSLSFAGIQPFFERVIEQKVLENNEFAFYLNTDSDQPSALLWGGVDTDLYEGPITMFPVVQLHYWALELVEFRLGDMVLGGTRHKGSNLKKLILDSGTTYFTTPTEMYSRVMDRIPEARCSDVESYKPLTYVLRGVHGDTFELIVTQETYMIGSATDDSGCRPAFMALDVNEKYGPAVILGEVFMRHFFTVFSRGDGTPEQAKVGFAAARIGAMPKVASKAPALQKATPAIRYTAQVDGDGDILAQGQVLFQAQNALKNETSAFYRGASLLQVDPRSVLQTPTGAPRYTNKWWPSQDRQS